MGEKGWDKSNLVGKVCCTPLWNVGGKVWRTALNAFDFGIHTLREHAARLGMHHVAYNLCGMRRQVLCEVWGLRLGCLHVLTLGVHACTCLVCGVFGCRVLAVSHGKGGAH